MIAGLVSGFLFAVRDLETAILYLPAGYDLLPVRLITWQANGDPAVVNGLALMQIGVTFLAGAVLLLASLAFWRGRDSAASYP